MQKGYYIFLTLSTYKIINLVIKLKGKEAKLKDFCKQTGLHRDKYREQVFAAPTENGIKNWGKSVSQKAVQSSQKHYDIWRKSIGADDTPKTLAKYYDMKYNDKKEYSRLQKYAYMVKKGNVSPLVGYNQYRDACIEVENTLIGLVTQNDIEVKDYSAHFVERVLGRTGLNKLHNKSAVDILNAKEAITSGKIGKTQYDKDGNPSIVFVGLKCIVSINPDNGNLIQTNNIK